MKMPKIRQAQKTAFNSKAAYADLKNQPKMSRSGRNISTQKPATDVPKRKVV